MITTEEWKKELEVDLLRIKASCAVLKNSFNRGDRNDKDVQFIKKVYCAKVKDYVNESFKE